MGMDMCYNDQLGLQAFTNQNNTKQLQQFYKEITNRMATHTSDVFRSVLDSQCCVVLFCFESHEA